jgi:Tfp pilus assembly protein PilO
MPRLSERDRRALLLLGVAAAVFVALQFGVLPRAAQGPESSTSLDLLEKRLARLQQVERQKPRAAAEAEAAGRDLGEVEKGLLKAATPAQASAEMQQLLRDLLRGQGLNMQSSEFGAIRPSGEDYAQVPLAVTFTGGIEQWINFMAALRNAPQVLSTLEIRLTSADQKNKTVSARMVVAGYIPAAMVKAPSAAGVAR